LIDKVWSPKNLESSLQKVVAKGGSAGVDNQSARQIEVHKDQTIAKLEQQLRAGQYQAQAVKRVWIPKPGSKEKRPLVRSTDGGFILHLIQGSFEIGCILIRLEPVTQALNSDSFCGVMVSQ
jgi:hypothetical protein